MDLQLSGKRALVTGSTAGIGLAIAMELAKEGATVIVNGRSRERTDAAVASVKQQARNATVSGIPADLSTAAGADELIRQLADVEILVNNVGIFIPTPFERIADAEWERLWQTNVMSGVRLSRHYLPRMLSANRGRIVFISSESGLQIPSEMIHYGVTKTAQIALARGMAETTAGTNVTVNSVLPGPTLSEGVDTFVTDLAKSGGKTREQLEADFFKTARPSSLIQRFATPEEVAHMVAYVCSPLASATNGAALRVDGGVVRAIG